MRCEESRIGVRFDDDGISYEGFRWQPLGEWTEAPDWSEEPVCGQGLHYQGPEAGGCRNPGKRLVVIETDGPRVGIDGDKCKSRRARIIAINDLAPLRQMRWASSLNLRGCTSLTALPEGLTVGGVICGAKELNRDAAE